MMNQKLSGLEIRNHLKRIDTLLSHHNEYLDITLDPEESMMNGYHDEPVRGQSHIQKITIGIQELTALSEFSIEEAMIPIVNIFHEASGHGGQMNTEFNKSTPLSKVLALNHYACRGSKYYYEGLGTFECEQYWKQPHEIAAQYVGIKMAHIYLTGIWGERDATEAICAYQKFRQDNSCSFLQTNKSYTDVGDILTDLNRTFQAAVYAHRHYDLVEARKFTPDDLRSFAAMKQDSKYLVQLESCRNGLKQDWIMASAYVWRHDYSHTIRTKPVFQDMTLDVDVAVRYLKQPVIPRPKPKDLDLQKLDMTKEIEALSSTQSGYTL